MFRRKASKLDGKEPKPPTKAEILEDLQTFNIDHIRLDETRQRLDDITLMHLKKTDSLIDSSAIGKSGETDENAQLEEWWDSFEKFLSDIDKLETYQKHLEAKKMNLTKLDETVARLADDINTRITDSLQKALDEIAENENDLK